MELGLFEVSMILKMRREISKLVVLRGLPTISVINITGGLVGHANYGASLQV
jgi:hypothetical protein